VETIFTESRSRRRFRLPQLLPEIRWMTSLFVKMFDVTMTNLMFSEHAYDVINRCAHRALRMLQSVLGSETAVL